MGLYKGDPANGGVLLIKKSLSTDKLTEAESLRLSQGVWVDSEVEALTLLEGLTASSD